MKFSIFESRKQAGEILARRVASSHFDNPIVLALPRGGVPVALEVARALKAPLDLLLVRKIGVPWQAELAAAAVVDGEKHDLVLNKEVIAMTGMQEEDINSEVARALIEIERRRKLYLGTRPAVPVAGHTVIVVDDGIATGTTVKAALQALRKRSPKKLVLAVPVAPADTIAELGAWVDEIICLQQPEPFGSVGKFYRDFRQVTDEEVVKIFAASK
jgi:putative phosphoribosyl transferase